MRDFIAIRIIVLIITSVVEKRVKLLLVMLAFHIGMLL